jgi:methyl-accepting chemotaxis protein-1 (serine sensor receptor)
MPCTAGARLEAAIKEANAIEEAVDTTRRAQVEFKKHVQEWKNLIIRGGNERDFESHTAEMDATGKDVLAELKKLDPLVKGLGLSSEGRPEGDHRSSIRSTKKYAAAITQYDPKDPQRTQLVDKMVRGIDRAATDRIDELVEGGAASAVTVREAELAATAVSERNTAIGLLALVTILVIATSLVIGVIVIRSIVTPLRTPPSSRSAWRRATSP